MKNLFGKIATFFHAPSYTRTLTLLGLVILAIVIPVTVIFLGQQTNIFQHASGNSCTNLSGVCIPLGVCRGEGLRCNAGYGCPAGQLCYGQVGAECGVNGDCGSGLYCARTGKCTRKCTQSLAYNKCYGDHYTCTFAYNANSVCGATDYNYQNSCTHKNGSCGYISCPVGEKPNSNNTGCVATSCKAAGDNCYTNNSCGPGQHEVTDANHSCSSSTNAGRICCAAGAPTPWYDCEKNGSLGGSVIRHTTTGTTNAGACAGNQVCQDPTNGLIFEADTNPMSIAYDKAKAQLCKAPTSLTAAAKTCIANQMCSGVTTAASIWKGLFDLMTNILYGACRNIYGGIPPLADFICNNGANFRNAFSFTVTSGVINACKNEVNGATTIIDIGTRAESTCVNSCSTVISINSGGFPPPVLFILGSVNAALRSSAVPVCKALCPHFASTAAQAALRACNVGDAPVKGEPSSSSLQEEAKKSVEELPTCSSKGGTCRSGNSCASGTHGIDATCTSGVCCVTDSGGGGGGGGPTATPTPSCTNGKTTQMALNVKLEGIGTGSFDNTAPAHTTRPGIYVKVTDQNAATLYSNTSTVFTYASGTFNAPNVSLGTALSCGHTYTATVKIPRYLPAKVTVEYGKSQNLSVNPTAGDINKVRLSDKVIVGDDRIDINDYAIVRACHNVDPTTPQNFTDGTTTVTLTCADLMNFFDYADGGTQGDEWSFNYNLWVRGFFKANGY